MASPEQADAPTTSGRGLQEASSRERCTKYFDALWFCYSPVYQMKQFYVHGTVDDCKAHWGAWFNCLRQKTRFKDEDAGVPKEPKHPLWELRTKEEAQEFWQREFGHLNTGEGEEDPLKARRKTTFF